MHQIRVCCGVWNTTILKIRIITFQMLTENHIWSGIWWDYPSLLPTNNGPPIWLMVPSYITNACIWLTVVWPNGPQFADGVFKRICVNGNVWIMNKTSLKYIFDVQLTVSQGLVEVMVQSVGCKVTCNYADKYTGRPGLDECDNCRVDIKPSTVDKYIT